MSTIYSNYNYPGEGHFFFENVKANSRVYRYGVEDAIELILKGETWLGLDSDNKVIKGFCLWVIQPLLATEFVGSVVETMRVLQYALDGEWSHMRDWLKVQTYFVEGRDADIQKGIRNFFYGQEDMLNALVNGTYVEPEPMPSVFEDDEIPF